MATGITPDNEHFIEEAIASGRFSSRDEALNKAIRLLREEAHFGPQPNGPQTLPADKWIEEVRSWAASHRRLDHHVDDSRESTYAGRGE